QQGLLLAGISRKQKAEKLLKRVDALPGGGPEPPQEDEPAGRRRGVQVDGEGERVVGGVQRRRREQGGVTTGPQRGQVQQAVAARDQFLGRGRLACADPGRGRHRLLQQRVAGQRLDDVGDGLAGHRQRLRRVGFLSPRLPLRQRLQVQAVEL